MRKLTITFCLVASFGLYQAVGQTTGTTTTPAPLVQTGFKPEGGDKNLEVQFTPLGGSPIQINGIRGRMFDSPTRAKRINVFLGFNSTSTITQQEMDSLEQLKNVNSSFTINLRPGMEYHMSGTQRLSPYVGWEADLAYSRTVAAQESQNGTDVNTTKTINAGGFFRIGVNAVAGFDFYVAKSLYLGAELGYGLSYRKGLAMKVTSDITGFNEPDPVKQGGTFNLGPTVNAAIRLGYIFGM